MDYVAPDLEIETLRDDEIETLRDDIFTVCSKRNPEACMCTMGGSKAKKPKKS